MKIFRNPQICNVEGALTCYRSKGIYLRGTPACGGGADGTAPTRTGTVVSDP